MKRIAILTVILACVATTAQADIVSDIAARVPARPHSYADMMTAMQKLHETERVECSSVGVTRRGRHVAMAVACDPERDPQDLRKLLIIARQHGNEPAGTEAALALLQHLAISDGRAERALLKRVALLVIPMANPDGVEQHARRTSTGTDLNRDWIALSQPETQAIERVFRQWQADAVIDLHELPAYSSKASYQENFVETIASCNPIPKLLGMRCGQTSAQLSIWMKRYGIPLNCYYDTPDDDRRLCHRHFGLDHRVPSFLFEAKTGRGRSLGERATYHVLGMLVVANQLAYHYTPQIRPPVQVAEKPQVEAPAASEVPQVTLGEPAPNHRERRAKLWAEVETTDEFAYLTFELDGRVLVLTNQRPYQYSLDMATCPEGPVEIAARAYDGSGRCIAADSRTITLVQPGAAMGQ